MPAVEHRRQMLAGALVDLAAEQPLLAALARSPTPASPSASSAAPAPTPLFDAFVSDMCLGEVEFAIDAVIDTAPLLKVTNGVCVCVCVRVCVCMCVF